MSIKNGDIFLGNEARVFRGSNYSCTKSGGVFNATTGRELRQKTKKTGYKEVCLYLKSGKKSFYAHRIVAECFIENVDMNPEVNHINGDKSDNNYSNLEWCTSSENQKHAFRTGLQFPIKLMDMKNGRYKGVIWCKNINTLEVFKIRSLTDCHKYGFNASSVSNVLNKKSNQYRSHIFSRDKDALLAQLEEKGDE